MATETEQVMLEQELLSLNTAMQRRKETLEEMVSTGPDIQPRPKFCSNAV